MSPIFITAEKMRDQKSRGLASPLESATNFPQVWQPQRWGASDIAALEMSASRSILQMAAKFRVNYLGNFYD